MFTMKKNKIKLGALCVLCVSLAFSCTSTSSTNTSAPSWVTDVHAEYAESNYLGAVGHAQDRSTAEAEAVANVSKIISQRVQAESTATQSFENNLTDLNRSYETTVTTSSVLDEIIGIKIQEVWTAKDNTVYALALIDRSEVGGFYAQKIRENEDAINGLLNFMIDNEATFEGVGAAQNALAIALENDAYLKLLSIINPAMFKSIDLAYKSSNAISVLIQLEKEKIYIGVNVSGDVDRRVSTALSNAFKSVGFKSESLTAPRNPTSSMPYILYGELLISPFEMSSSQNNKYVRFTLNTELVDIKNKTFLPWGLTGREAHLTEDEAAQRALRTIEEEIKKEYAKELQNLSS